MEPTLPTILFFNSCFLSTYQYLIICLPKYFASDTWYTSETIKKNYHPSYKTSYLPHTNHLSSYISSFLFQQVKLEFTFYHFVTQRHGWIYFTMLQDAISTSDAEPALLKPCRHWIYIAYIIKREPRRVNIAKGIFEKHI